MRRRPVVLAAVLALAACSGGEEAVQPAPSTTTSAPGTTAPATTGIAPGTTERTLRAELTEVHDFPGPPDKGSVVLTLRAGEAQICYEISLRETDRATATHIHEGTATAATLNPRLGMPGQTAGGPRDGRGGHAVARGCEPAPPGVVDRLLAQPSSFSVDVHTAAAPGGAVSGRLSP
ncbi:MAG: CHRD domain-containing protein [Actinomycetota bacterium]|nr:CHRD domain-containing protein [Actinomycetota bacterium]